MIEIKRFGYYWLDTWVLAITMAATILLAAGLLAGCSGSESDDVNELKPELTNEAEMTEITVKTNLSRMLTKTGPAIVNSNTALQGYDLKIDAYFHGTETAYLSGTKLHYDSSVPAAWKFWVGSAPGSETHYYWPIEGSVYDPASANITVSSLDFVGYCPYDNLTLTPYITPNSYTFATGASFSCDMSSYMTNAAQEGMKEYLIAVLKDQTYADQETHGGVPLQFKHPFALIKFVITAASGTHVQINSISIAGLNTSATCTYNGSTMNWASYSGSAAMTITKTLKNGGATETDYFMVIPKDYGSKFLTVNATWDDWSNVTISDYGTDVDFNWEPGYIYTYNLTLNEYGLIVDSSKFTEQW